MYVVKAVACLRLFLCFMVLDPIYDLPSIIELTSVSFSFCLCLFLSVCLSPSLCLFFFFIYFNHPFKSYHDVDDVQLRIKKNLLCSTYKSLLFKVLSQSCISLSRIFQYRNELGEILWLP